MSFLPILSSSLNRKDETLNQELAKEITKQMRETEKVSKQKRVAKVVKKLS